MALKQSFGERGTGRLLAAQCEQRKHCGYTRWTGQRGLCRMLHVGELVDYPLCLRMLTSCKKLHDSHLRPPSDGQTRYEGRKRVDISAQQRMLGQNVQRSRT